MFAFVNSIQLCGVYRLGRTAICPRQQISVFSSRTAMMCTNISRDDVRKTARLAQLELSDEELDKVTPDFKKIIGFIDRMNEENVEGVEPMARPYDVEILTRPDEPKQFPDV